MRYGSINDIIDRVHAGELIVEVGNDELSFR
jgi:hypothetical protein